MAKWPVGHNWFFMKLELIQVWLQDWVGGVSLIPLEDYFKATPFWDSILLFCYICKVKRITKSFQNTCHHNLTSPSIAIQKHLVFCVLLMNVIISLSLAEVNGQRQRQQTDKNVVHSVLFINMYHSISLDCIPVLFARINECIHTHLFLIASCHFSH